MFLFSSRLIGRSVHVLWPMRMLSCLAPMGYFALGRGLFPAQILPYQSQDPYMTTPASSSISAGRVQYSMSAPSLAQGRSSLIFLSGFPVSYRIGYAIVDIEILPTPHFLDSTASQKRNYGFNQDEEQESRRHPPCDGRVKQAVTV